MSGQHGWSSGQNSSSYQGQHVQQGYTAQFAFPSDVSSSQHAAQQYAYEQQSIPSTTYTASYPTLPIPKHAHESHGFSSLPSTSASASAPQSSTSSQGLGQNHQQQQASQQHFSAYPASPSYHHYPAHPDQTMATRAVTTPASDPWRHEQHLHVPFADQTPYTHSPVASRDRYSISQSPMSDVYPSGGPSRGRTFNLMAGLETPTPANPSHRPSTHYLDGSPSSQPQLLRLNQHAGIHLSPSPKVQHASVPPPSSSHSSQWNQASTSTLEQASSRSYGRSLPNAYQALSQRDSMPYAPIANEYQGQEQRPWPNAVSQSSARSWTSEHAGFGPRFGQASPSSSFLYPSDSNHSSEQHQGVRKSAQNSRPRPNPAWAAQNSLDSAWTSSQPHNPHGPPFALQGSTPTSSSQSSSSQMHAQDPYRASSSAHPILSIRPHHPSSSSSADPIPSSHTSRQPVQGQLPSVTQPGSQSLDAAQRNPLVAESSLASNHNHNSVDGLATALHTSEKVLPQSWPSPSTSTLDTAMPAQNRAPFAQSHAASPSIPATEVIARNQNKLMESKPKPKPRRKKEDPSTVLKEKVTTDTPSDVAAQFQLEHQRRQHVQQQGKQHQQQLLRPQPPNQASGANFYGLGQNTTQWHGEGDFSNNTNEKASIPPQIDAPNQLSANPFPFVSQGPSIASSLPGHAMQPRVDPGEPQTPPLPSHSLLTVQESPDPLNLFSPHANVSAWQLPGNQSASPFPPPSPSAYPNSQTAIVPSTNSKATKKTKEKESSKRKDLNGETDLPEKKPKKKLKHESSSTTHTLGQPLHNETIAQHRPLSSEATELPTAGKSKKTLIKIKKDDKASLSPLPVPSVFVEIPTMPHKYGGPIAEPSSPLLGVSASKQGDDSNKKKTKKKRSKKSFADLVNEIVEDSDSGIDAEGSDWDEVDMLAEWSTPIHVGSEPALTLPKGPGKVSTGPVKTSHRKVPVAKLRGFMEDLFEADDALPDKDALQDMLPGQGLPAAADPFFEIVQCPSSSGAGVRSTLVLRASVLQRLLKLVIKCSRSLNEVSATASKAAVAGSAELSSIAANELIRLLNILERTAKVGEDIDPFTSQANRSSLSQPASPTKRKKAGQKPARSSRSPSKAPSPEDEEEDGQMDEDEQIPSPPTEGARQDEMKEHAESNLETLNISLAFVDRSVLAAECCLGILTGDVLPKQILSEDLIRSCFESVKTCLDKILLPFIEACSGTSATSTHPVLMQLIDVLAPQKMRKKKAAKSNEETPTSIGIICRNTLSDVFRHLCSALFFVQRMVRMPSVAFSDSITISAVYLALGPFFVLEPEQATGGGANSENARASARGRSALLSLGGANTMKTLRLPALHLLRNIFAKSIDQRQWMIEEILTSLTKLTDMKKNRRQYSLRNGKGIHSINALLLQLIQAASHGISDYVRTFTDRLARSQEQGADDEATAEEAEGPIMEVVIQAFEANEAPVTDARELKYAIWRKGLEGAHHSARSIAAYLMQRVGQTKVVRSSQEMSHAFIIENMIQDLLSALYLPEWPAAPLMLSSFCRVFGTYLEDPKSHPDAKGVALEQLGLVAARLRQSQIALTPKSIKASSESAAAGEAGISNGVDTSDLRNELSSSGQHKSPLTPIKKPKWTSWDYLSMLRALRDLDQNAIHELVKAYGYVFRFLSKIASEDQSTEAAAEFLLVQAQGELALACARAREEVDALQSNADDRVAEIAKVQYFREELENAMADLSHSYAHELDLPLAGFETDDQASAKATELCEWALMASSSMISYEILRDHIIEGLNNQLIANRTKALRSIDRVAQIDPDLLDQDVIRSAIEVRLRDSSSSVRESAVGLFGNYLLRKPQYLPKHYQELAGRVHDTGLAVRKRMIRLLKSIHEVTDNWEIRVDTCARLVHCINDEDTLVQDLAVLTLGEMWLNMDIGDIRRLRRRGSPGVEMVIHEANGELALAGDAGGSVDASQHVDDKLTDTIAILMAVIEVLKDRTYLLEEVFRRIFKDRTDNEAAELHAKMQKLGDSMIDTLVEANEASDVDTVKRIRIVQLLVATNPAILTISKAKLLLPYLKAAQTSEEVQIMDLLLRIFRSCLPHMPKTALAFAEALEKSLRPLVSRPPPRAGTALLQELVACFCAVINLHTHNFTLLIKTLKACFVRVHGLRQMAIKGQKVEGTQAWQMLMNLTASLCEHADFDNLRKKYPETSGEIDSISKRPLVEVVSETLLDIHKHSSEKVRSVSLLDLGWIFRAHPTLMTRPQMTAMMDTIFATGSLQDRRTLLKIILDFLSADAIRRNPDQAVVHVGGARRKPEAHNASNVDMTVLVGNTESFADTGVGSAMMQRYSEDVLKATLEVSDATLQKTAVEILRYTVLQGLSHPIQCIPYLVSLETLENAKIRNRALELHGHLASKHASLVQARFLDSARSAFKFQLKISGGQGVRGYRMETLPTAMLNAWYGLLRDRRQTRLDFLKQIVKAMDINITAADSGVEEVLFARFMADNLATLDYKTMEELFTVIGELRSILAVSGMQVLHMIQPHLPPEAALPSNQLSLGDEAKTPPPPPPSGLDIAVEGAAGDMISPLGLPRNPWMTGEWQLELASDGSFGGSSVPETIDPNRIFGHMNQDFAAAAVDVNTANGKDEQETQQPKEDGEATVKNATDPIAVARMSVIAGTALLLRNHLKHLYSLSEARCAKFNPTKKQSAGADKPATMRNLSDPMQAALDLGTMPFGLAEIKTEEDAKVQMKAYAVMVENEGTMMEPEDADMMEDLAL